MGSHAFGITSEWVVTEWMKPMILTHPLQVSLSSLLKGGKEAIHFQQSYRIK